MVVITAVVVVAAAVVLGLKVALVDLVVPDSTLVLREVK
jgi:hypothetical protein